MPERIALISEHASPLEIVGGVDSGGQNIFVAQIARNLAARGVAVDVFTRRDSTELSEIVDWHPGVRVIHVPAGPARYVPKEELLPCMADFAAWMVEWCRGGNYDLQHANFFMSGAVAMAVKRELGIPFVITFHALGRVRRLHQGEADRFPSARICLEDEIIADADGLIAECPQDYLDLTRLYAADPRRICIIPCGFDSKEFWPIARKLARRALHLDPGERILLSVSRMVPRKGLDNAVRGAARLTHGHGLRARLIVVGGNSDVPDPAATPEIGRLRAVAREERYEERVVFTGRRSREFLKLYYSAADVFVTTPWYEPFGITPLEAMACGTPVVGSNVGGIRYSVVDGVTGALVPPNDPDALAGTLAALYREPARLRECGREGLRRACAQFTWPKVTRSVAGFYDRVIAQGAVSAHAVRLPLQAA